MLRRTRAAAVVAATATVLISTACAGGGGGGPAPATSPDGKTVLTWWHNATQDTLKNYFQDAADRYTAAHPDVPVVRGAATPLRRPLHEVGASLVLRLEIAPSRGYCFVFGHKAVVGLERVEGHDKHCNAESDEGFVFFEHNRKLLCYGMFSVVYVTGGGGVRNFRRYLLRQKNLLQRNRR